ncbi:helix-turn-helix domain-containing protein [Tissierella sp.]|uniref:helix-turn-helix domain-containing protein n=1 Tax=Tissierella sp. TaxID=41274 RepID=UPI003058B1FB
MEIQDIISYFAKEIAKHIPTQDVKQPEEVMTIKDMEQFLQVSRSKAYELIKIEGFPAYKVGSEFRMLKSELVKWMKTQKEV